MKIVISKSSEAMTEHQHCEIVCTFSSTETVRCRIEDSIALIDGGSSSDYEITSVSFYCYDHEKEFELDHDEYEWI